MNVLSDSFSILTNHWRLISGVLLIILLGQILIWSALKMIFEDRLTSDEYYSLSIAGWVLPILLASVLWFPWRLVQLPQSSALIVFIFIAILILIFFLRIRKKTLQDSKAILSVLLTLFGISIFLRLAFVSKAVIPLYFDSAQHYLLIRNLIENPVSNATASFTWPTTVYYHIGFHLLIALITSVLHTEIINAILIVGQLILAVIPLSVFFLIKHETRSNSAGIFAVLLAAFGWYMPAHAVDWGKYPALTSLVFITFVLSMAYLSHRYKSTLSSRKYWSLNVLLLSGILLSGFIHSRSLVIFGIVAVAWLLAAWWQKFPKLPRSLFFLTIILGMVLEIVFIRTQAVFNPLFDPYSAKGLLITSIVLFLSIFAQKAYPRLAFCCILAILLLLGSLFIPVTGIPGYPDLTLLDRPFVEMILYLPLSLLGGLGLAGLKQGIQQAQARLGNTHFWWGRYAGILFSGVVLINAMTQYNLYPSDCCDIVGRDDIVAIDWMDKNLPAEARVLVSSTELRVMATDSFQGSVGGDAGIWITPLISRATIPLPYYSDLGQQTTFDEICKMEINFIYLGETGLTFDDSQIIHHPDWYKILLSMPKVKVYQVIGCK